jgi:hypothetical protein
MCYHHQKQGKILRYVFPVGDPKRHTRGEKRERSFLQPDGAGGTIWTKKEINPHYLPTLHVKKIRRI